MTEYSDACEKIWDMLFSDEKTIQGLSRGENPRGAAMIYGLIKNGSFDSERASRSIIRWAYHFQDGGNGRHQYGVPGDIESINFLIGVSSEMRNVRSDEHTEGAYAKCLNQAEQLDMCVGFAALAQARERAGMPPFSPGDGFAPSDGA